MEAKALKFHQISNVFRLEELLGLHVGFEKVHATLRALAATAVRAVAKSRQVMRRAHLVGGARGEERISRRSCARMLA